MVSLFIRFFIFSFNHYFIFLMMSKWLINHRILQNHQNYSEYTLLKAFWNPYCKLYSVSSLTVYSCYISWIFLKPTSFLCYVSSFVSMRFVITIEKGVYTLHSYLSVLLALFVVKFSSPYGNMIKSVSQICSIVFLLGIC